MLIVSFRVMGIINYFEIQALSRGPLKLNSKTVQHQICFHGLYRASSSTFKTVGGDIHGIFTNILESLGNFFFNFETEWERTAMSDTL